MDYAMGKAVMNQDAIDSRRYQCEVAYEAGKKDGIRGISESRAMTNSKQYEDSDQYLEGYYDFLAQ
jgi:hypothetical protein